MASFYRILLDACGLADVKAQRIRDYKRKKGVLHMGNIISIILQLISGGIGGTGAGKAMPKLSLGKIGDIIAGILGGLGGCQLLSALDLGGGVGGGALMAIIGAIKNILGAKKT